MSDRVCLNTWPGPGSCKSWSNVQLDFGRLLMQAGALYIMNADNLSMHKSIELNLPTLSHHVYIDDESAMRNYY